MKHEQKNEAWTSGMFSGMNHTLQLCARSKVLSLTLATCALFFLSDKKRMVEILFLLF